MEIKGNAENNNDKIAKVCYEMIIKMYEKEYSEIIEIFLGIHISQIISLDGYILSNRPEPFFTIDLPIPTNKKNIIIYCLNYYSQAEKMEGRKCVV